MFNRILRFFKRLIKFNRNFELQRHLKSVRKSIGQITPLWNHMTLEQKKNVIQKSTVTRILLDYWKIANDAFGEDAIDAEKW